MRVELRSNNVDSGSEQQWTSSTVKEHGSKSVGNPTFGFTVGFFMYLRISAIVRVCVKNADEQQFCHSKLYGSFGESVMHLQHNPLQLDAVHPVLVIVGNS
tara:strand:+ start:2299 stop:2601 length:303 start_codon:yes stop_codon:yes gene_type:complete